MAPAFPESIRNAHMPRLGSYYPSTLNNWQDETIYFLLPDRFSDGQQVGRPLLERTNLPTARGGAWNWKAWSDSGRGRWQGETIRGIRSKLQYLKDLHVTTIWVGPVFRQRKELDTFHGYSIQDFLDVDPHFGTAQDLVALVNTAHDIQLRIILDIIFHHSGNNWVYDGSVNLPPYNPYPNQYKFGNWRNGRGLTDFPGTALTENDGVWPLEIQDPNCYMRAGVTGDLNNGPDDNPDDGTLPYRRSDFPPDGYGLRSFNPFNGNTLSDLALCYKYWIALTDCDGFRIDTVKHITVNVSRAFLGSMKEFADARGKHDFFLVSEIGGGDVIEREYLDDTDAYKMNAALDIGDARRILRLIGKGLAKPRDYFKRYKDDPDGGESRLIGSRLVSVLDDRDNLNVERIRMSWQASSEHQIVAGVALQLFTLTIPCIYYGTEQAFSFYAPEKNQVSFLIGEGWGTSDHFLREAMFGPEHPHVPGIDGLGYDLSLPGFGPFGSAGHHCFDPSNPTYVRIRHLLEVRNNFQTLRRGRQSQRPIGQFGWNNLDYPAGELIAWSRILDDHEALCVVNGNGDSIKSGAVLVDANLNAPGSVMQVVANTAEIAAIAAGLPYQGSHSVGSDVGIERSNPTGAAFVSIQGVGPSEVLVLAMVNLA
jgi:glycosidase